MRLTCPNCGAQYEVPPEAIPPTGREVQCSNCQQLWFERGAAPAPQLVDPTPWDGMPAPTDSTEEDDDLADVQTAPPPQAPPRPRVDPVVSKILREEAQREEAARAAEGPAPATPEIRRPAAHRAPNPGATPAPARPAARTARSVDRELDLDQINSTLRTQDRAGTRAPRPEAQARRGSGFGRGFWGTLLVLAVLAALYAFRPRITEALPATAAVLDPYARAVDAARDGLDGLVARLIGAAP